MLTLFRSHSVEVLADALAQRLQHDVSSGVVSDPVTAQHVLVRTRAMGRWLALRLSEAGQPARGGICANVRFHNGDRFLRNLVANLAAVVDLDHDPWHPLKLRWSVAAELRDLQHSIDPLWQPLLQLWRCQQGDLIDRYRLGMLSGLADIFDRYTLYRQEMVLQWLQGRPVDGQGEPLPPEQCWQAALYQRLHQRLGGLSPAERLRHAKRHLDDVVNNNGCLPSLPSGPLRVFCPGHLPMPHLELVATMAHHGSQAVELFVLTPSARPWGSIQERQRLLQQVDALRDYMGLLRANGHRLLASLGASMRQFQATLEHLQQRQPLEVVDRFPATPAPSERGETEASPSLLERLRTDMLHLLNRDRLASDPAWQPLPVSSTDDSIKVLRCSSDLGQVEALRRWLLLLFHRHRHLQPRHVLVMTPDVERFAPLMRAVFMRTNDGDVHLPLHVADRLLRQDDPLLNLVLLLLELTDERLDPSQLQDLLLHPLIHSQLGLEPGDGPAVAQLMQAMGVHWGIDADHRHRLGLPRDEVHTWRWGLRRLALALALDDPVAATLSAAQQGRYAVIDDPSAPRPQQGCWQGLAAVPLRNDQVPLAHRLFGVLSQLVDAIDWLTPPRPRQQWAAHLRSVLLQLLGHQPPAGDGLLGLQVALEGLAGTAAPGEDSSSAPAIDAAAARCLLEESAANAQPYRGRHSAAVTLAALNPMRSIPHPVICLLGMDEGRIPRRDVQPAYNLMAAQPHPGDPDRGQDDRGLLLEALLASGGWLVATFTGSDPRTGEDRNPASPISELLTCLDRGFDLQTANGDLSPVAIRDHLLQDEPALPVDPLLYGDGDSQRCFDASGVAAARALAAGVHNAPRPLPAHQIHQAHQTAPGPVVAEPPLQAPGDRLALDDLLAFWKDPHQQLLKAHHLAAPRPPGLPPGVEADELDGLEQWQLHQMLLLLLQTPGEHGTMAFAPHLATAWAEGLQRRGYLPPAVGGRLLLQRSETRIAKLLDRAAAACRDGGAVSREAVVCTVQLPATGPADGGTTGLPQHLDGNLEGLWLPQQHQRLQLTASKLDRPDRFLQRWIEHLVLNAAQGGGWQSVWIGFDQECLGLAWDPLEASAAARLLGDLVLLRCQGLRQPLPFEPQISWQPYKEGRAASRNPTPSWRLLHPAWCHAPRAWGQQPAVRAMGQRVFGPLGTILKAPEMPPSP